MKGLLAIGFLVMMVVCAFIFVSVTQRSRVLRAQAEYQSLQALETAERARRVSVRLTTAETLDRQSQQIAKQLQSIPKSDNNRRQQLKHQLTQVLQKAFDARQTSASQRAEELKMRLKEIEKTIEVRHQNKTLIIENRISELLGKGGPLSWRGLEERKSDRSKPISARGTFLIRENNNILSEDMPISAAPDVEESIPEFDDFEAPDDIGTIPNLDEESFESGDSVDALPFDSPDLDLLEEPSVDSDDQQDDLFGRVVPDNGVNVDLPGVDLLAAPEFAEGGATAEDIFADSQIPQKEVLDFPDSDQVIKRNIAQESVQALERQAKKLNKQILQAEKENDLDELEKLRQKKTNLIDLKKRLTKTQNEPLDLLPANDDATEDLSLFSR